MDNLVPKRAQDVCLAGNVGTLAPRLLVGGDIKDFLKNKKINRKNVSIFTGTLSKSSRPRLATDVMREETIGLAAETLLLLVDVELSTSIRTRPLGDFFRWSCSLFMDASRCLR